MTETVQTTDRCLTLKPKKFPVIGQGIFLYTSKHDLEIALYVSPKKNYKEQDIPNKYIALEIGFDYAQFTIKRRKHGCVEVLEKVQDIKHPDKVGVQYDRLTTYWYSYDRDGLVLKYGKGYTMEETTHLTHDFLKDCKTKKEKEEKRKELERFFGADHDKYVWIHTKKRCLLTTEPNPLIEKQPVCQFQPNPFVCNFAPMILDSSKVTMFDLDTDKMMFSSSLPRACKELYGNIKGIVLEYPENPIMKLSDAIRYSINTRGCTLYKKLKEKLDDFPEPDMAYLRVTLGPDTRTAPGVPYVLEIWPSGNRSPIHNHGGTCAIIKVLFGRITVNIYNKQTNPPEEKQKVIQKFDAKEGDITWIGPNWFQTHHLKNRTDDFCATIQCYRYEEGDTIHWPDFDYIDEKCSDKTLEQFFPNSDFSFIHLRSKVLEEYQHFLAGHGKGPVE